MTSSNRPIEPGKDEAAEASPVGADSWRAIEITRPLQLGRDLSDDLLEDEAEEGDEGEEDGEDSEVIFLEESESWALLLPEGAILHSHGVAEDNAEEAVFYECEPAEGPDGEALIRCSECGATVAEAEIEALIDELAVANDWQGDDED